MPSRIVWLRRLRTDPELYRRVVIVLLVAILFAGCIKVVTDSSLVLGTKPSVLSVSLSRALYCSDGQWNLSSAMVATVSNYNSATKTYSWDWNPSPVTSLTSGYLKGEEEGPLVFRTWIGVERLWIQAGSVQAPDGNNATPDPAMLASFLTTLAPEILADVRVAKRTIGVTALRHERRWINWRGFIGWWSTFFLIVSATLLLTLVIMDRIWPRRPHLILAGRCPRCRYDIASLDVPRCPECGEELTQYEQTIVANLRRRG